MYICVGDIAKGFNFVDMISNALQTELLKLTHKLILAYKERVCFETTLKAETALCGFFNGYEFHHVSNKIFISLA